MINKSKVSITVAGHEAWTPAIIRTISEALKHKGIETEENWAEDSPPLVNTAASKFESMARRVFVSIQDLIPKKHKSGELLDDFKVKVEFSKEKGYSTVLFMMGKSLRCDMGNEPHSQEQARSLATRIATELGLDVIDVTKNIHEWVQPR